MSTLPEVEIENGKVKIENGIWYMEYGSSISQI